MTTTFTDQRALLDDCDVDDWTVPGDGLDTSAPSPVEASGSLGLVVSTETQEAYDTITSDDWSAGGTYFAWGRPYGAMDTLVNGGVMLVIGDGTNREGYHVGGSDKAGFRHSDGPVEWTCFVMDPANKPANSTNFAGSEASLNEAAITQVGMAFKTLAKSVGGSRNCHIDIMRWADIGVGVTFTGGTTSGAAGDMAEAAALDRATTTLSALGVVHEIADGVFGIQGNIILGDSTSSSDQYWTEVNATYAWEDRGLSTNNYYRFALIGSSTATNCEFSFTSHNFIVPAAASASFDGDGADITVCDLIGCIFTGFDQGVETSSIAAGNWMGNIYNGCGQIVENGCDITNSTISGSVVAADTGALLFNRAVDPDGYLDNISFTMGAASHHAIDFGTNVSSALTSITLTGISFNGFGSTDDANDSTLRFLATTGSLTLNLIGCTVDGVSPVASGGGQNFSVDDAAGMTVTVVVAPVTLQVTCTDKATELPVQNVQTSIHLKASPFTELMNEDTTASGIASESYAGSTPVDIVWKCRKSDDLDTPRYFAQSGLGQITTAGFTLAVLMEENTIIP